MMPVCLDQGDRIKSYILRGVSNVLWSSMKIKKRVCSGKEQFSWGCGYLLGGFLCGLLSAVGGAHAQNYTWRSDVLPALEGTWVGRGQDCDKDTSLLMIFSAGGYRWRKAPTDWGYARGKYSWQRGATRVAFRLQRFNVEGDADFMFTIVGDEMRKFTYASGRMTRFERCPD